MERSIAVALLFVTLALVSWLPLSGKTSVLDSLACSAVNDGTMIVNQASQVGIQYNGSYYYVGDGWNWFDMYAYAGFAYISFPRGQVWEGYQLIAATLHYYVMNCYGNSEQGVYPSFEFTWGTVNPHCRLTHVDYGATLEAADLNAPELHPPLNLFNSYLPGWNWVDVTAYVNDDLDQKRPFSQYTLKLEYGSD